MIINNKKMIYINGGIIRHIIFNTISSINILYLLLLTKIINCLLEIPFEVVNIKKFSIKDNRNYKQIPTIFVEEGVTKINSQHLFLANIKIGSNSQMFKLILDTGSSLTWVADSHIKIENNAKISNTFDPKSSSSCQTFYEYFDIRYGTGSCSGYYYIDTIKYIKNKDFKLKFGVANTANFDFNIADGIIGMSRSNKDISTSFISMLYYSKIIDSTLFSFKFASNNLDLPMGKMFIGKHEDFSKKNAFSCDLLNNNYGNLYYWTCQLKSFGLQNNYHKTFSNHTIPIIFDTGTNFIFLPFEYLKDMEKDIKKFGCKINEYEDNNQDFDFDKNQMEYRLVCSANNLPQFLFILGETTFTLPNDLLFYYERGLAYSYIIFILNNKQANPYIFGSSFFMSFHTLFNEEDEKLEFYPLKSKYIIVNKTNKIKIVIAIVIIISLYGIFFYMIYLFIKWKKEKKEKDEYQNIIPNDINIEMSNK